MTNLVALRAGSEPRITVLESGLTIVTQSMDHARTASIGIHAKAGSRNEAPHEHGLAHFLEHMAFKGTRKRDARAIAEDIEAAGGELNAETSVENTGYLARVLGEDVPVAIDILSDILLDSVFDPDEIRREKSVIVQEIGSYDDAPDELVYDLFLAHAFPGQAIGRPILGSKASVRGFDRAAIQAYLAREYRAGSMVLGAAGQVDHDAIVDQARSALSGLSPGANPAPDPARYVGGEALHRRKLEQTHVVIGLPGLSFADPRHYAMQAFANVVGGGMASRLFQEVREKRGLAYSVEAFHWPFSDCGIFGISGGTDAKDAREFVKVALACVTDTLSTMDERELQRTKAQVKVALLSASESPARRADTLARQMMIHGRLLNDDEILARIDALTIADVTATGQTILSGAPTIAVVGAGKILPNVDLVRTCIGAPMPLVA